uniref:Uncharacterized protein n=1 Tax=Columba livia TaxID=8932 RepID=R7VWX3_COLLI
MSLHPYLEELWAVELEEHELRVTPSRNRVASLSPLITPLINSFDSLASLSHLITPHN